MLLTSWNRLRYVMSDSNGPLDNNYINKRTHFTHIYSISSRVEQFLNRDIELKSYTEYFDVEINQREFVLRAYPVTVLTSVYSDSTGLYTGSESEENDPYIGSDSQSVVLESGITPARKGLRVIYTGGLAAHATQSQYTISSPGATTLVAGNFVEGQTSGAMGLVISLSSTTLTIEILYGIYIVGETIAGKNTEDGSNISGATAVLSSRDVACLAETYPDIVGACEYELMYMERHLKDFENLSTIKGQTTRKDMTQDYNLLPEVRGMLEKYIHWTI